MYNHKGHYICECGKEFIKSQSFNAHKSSCRIHLGDEKWQARMAKSKQNLAKATAAVAHHKKVAL